MDEDTEESEEQSEEKGQTEDVQGKIIYRHFQITWSKFEEIAN